jgi:hypothetical protein
MMAKAAMTWMLFVMGVMPVVMDDLAPVEVSECI